MTKLKVFVFLIFSVFISACNTTYQPKVGEPVARLRFSSLDRHAYISIQEKTCPIPKIIASHDFNASVGSEGKTIGIIGIPEEKNNSTELLISAEKRLSIQVGYLYSGSTSCTINGEFTPQANVDYELQFYMHRNSCSARFLSLVKYQIRLKK